MTQVGKTAVDRNEMRNFLAEFATLYEKRPVRDNQGGMSSSHLFPLWFLLRKLRPTAVIESGVWRGLGTWMIEQACPEADLYAIDINWKNLQYRSVRARYISTDITKNSWSHLPKQDTVVFFDDHIDELQRFKWCVSEQFRHILFEDNYPPGRGDCYSMKKVLAHAGHRAFPGLKARLSRMLGRLTDRTIAPNASDAEYVTQHAELIQELPPIFKREYTRWGDPWDSRYPTPEPLLTKVEKPYEQIFYDEATGYTWLCYVRLKWPST